MLLNPEVNLDIKKILNNMIVHWVSDNEIVGSRGYTLYVSADSGETFKKFVDIKVPSVHRLLSCNRLFSRALRLGIRALLKLRNGNMLIVANRKLFLYSGKLPYAVYSFEHGVGPLRSGLCEDDNGNIYVGEYFPNNSRKHAVKLIKSEDGGRSWEVLQTFKNIRHIHCVQYDPYERLLWLGTGDRDEESKIMFSENYGENWKSIGFGSQMFRTVKLLFTEEYVYWGTDTPARQSYIYRYVRRSGKIERLTPVSGPVYDSTILENGIKIFSTGVEGNSEGKSAAWDNKAHMWISLNGVKYMDIISFEKDLWPYILGYGRIIFPYGRKSKMLIFTTQCLKNNDNTSFISYLAINGN